MPTYKVKEIICHDKRMYYPGDDINLDIETARTVTSSLKNGPPPLEEPATLPKSNPKTKGGSK